YQGPIDNQFTKRGRLTAATEHYLSHALEAVLNEKQVERSYVPASGCHIERRDPPASQESFTYYRDIAPILQANCQRCHRPGEVGPFALLKYEDAYYNASTISEVVTERRMPPWHGELNPEFGKLKNDARLSDKEISTLVNWVKQ